MCLRGGSLQVQVKIVLLDDKGSSTKAHGDNKMNKFIVYLRVPACVFVDDIFNTYIYPSFVIFRFWRIAILLFRDFDN